VLTFYQTHVFFFPPPISLPFRGSFLTFSFFTQTPFPLSLSLPLSPPSIERSPPLLFPLSCCAGEKSPITFLQLKLRDLSPLLFFFFYFATKSGWSISLSHQPHSLFFYVEASFRDGEGLFSSSFFFLTSEVRLLLFLPPFFPH